MNVGAIRRRKRPKYAAHHQVAAKLRPRTPNANHRVAGQGIHLDKDQNPPNRTWKCAHIPSG